MVYVARYGLFGAAVDDVMGYLLGAGFGDVATVRRTVGEGSTGSLVVVDSTVGLCGGDRVHAVVGGHDETGVIDEVVSATSFSVTPGFSDGPAAGSLVDNGPEFVWRELVRAESFVVSKLPERYRGLIDRVVGEVVVGCAEEGQSTAVLGLTPAGTVRLYRNVEGLVEDLGPDDEMAGGWSLEGRTITFSPGLTRGERVLASYEVTELELPVLGTLLMDLATYRVGRKLVGMFERATPEWLVSFRDRGEGTLEEIFSRGRGIPELDGLRLWEDWERPGGGVRCGVVERG